ncbi:MAG: alpha amylase C-terminal domain-containing protein, partial [Flavisolibacter sp.]
IAEEATDWPMVSSPTFEGGLGFGMKWMMGWMHDTLDYFKIDTFFRPHHQNKFSFSMMYFYDENFMLPLSHDEVVHGKSPMIYKMPGDEWQKFANLRTMYSYMWTHPGGRLLFMGNEFGQTREWNYKSELDWFLLQHEQHRKLQACVKDLNHLLTGEEALYSNQFTVEGFEWVDLNHRSESIIVYARKGKKHSEQLLVILNLAPVPRWDWVVEVGRQYKAEIFNSDLAKYGGTGDISNPDIRQDMIENSTVEISDHISLGKNPEKRYRLTINLPPLAAIVLK